MTDKIAVDRDFLEHAVVALEYAYSADDEMVQESIKFLRAALAAQPAEVPRCKYCDGTGDVHGIDGEWRGRCTECNFAAQEPRTREEKEQYAFEDWLASECPSGSVEAVQRQWEESAEYLELQDDTPAQPAPAAVPPGYVLVPVEPTYEINKAIRMAVRAGCFDDGIYRAMIAAAGDKP